MIYVRNYKTPSTGRINLKIIILKVLQEKESSRVAQTTEGKTKVMM